MSIAVSKVNPSRLKAEESACESLTGSALHRDLAMVIAAYVPEQFEGLALFYELICFEFFRKKWPSKATSIAGQDEASRNWLVLAANVEAFVDGPLFYVCQIRYIEFAQEYRCIARVYPDPIPLFDENGIKIKPPTQDPFTEQLVPQLEGRYPNVEELSKALSKF